MFSGKRPCHNSSLAIKVFTVPVCVITLKTRKLKSNKIAEHWKIARVSAIHIKGNRMLASNYRPVSITSIVCRVLET